MVESNIPKVLLAGCAGLPRGDGDEEVLLPALAAAGCSAEWIVWDDPDNGAADADLVILRATWDYAPRRAEFLRWCASVPNLRNPVDVVRWNTDKAYLLDLAAAGVPIVPTELVPPGVRVPWPDTDFVVKPSVGAGSRGARRFGADDVQSARHHLDALHEDGLTVLVQPYQDHVDTEGETAMVFIAGGYSHAFVKGAMLGDASMNASGLFVEERVSGTDAEPDLVRFAEHAMDAAAEILGIDRAGLLYARVDVVRGNGGVPMLLELELAEPSLGLRFAGPAGPLRLASVVRDVLG